MTDPDLSALAAAHGVATSYEDWSGERVPVGEGAVLAALAALGVDASTPQALATATADLEAAPWRRTLPPAMVVREGEPARVDVRGDGPLHVALEDGTAREVALTSRVLEERDGTALRRVELRGLPLGWHRLSAGADSCVLLVAPRTIGLPPGLDRTWGWMVQLYALRSADSWAVGDYGDLRTVVTRTREQGGGVVLANPLHAETPVLPINPSPYSPSSRRFRSPLHLRVQDVAEHAAAPQELRDRIAALRPRTDPDRVERDPAWSAKLAALELLWPQHRADALAAFRAELGDALEDFALFCALAQEHGVPWQQWPEDLRRPDGAGIAAARVRHRERVAFWCWVQLLVDEQLAAVTVAAGDMPVGVVHDLAVGVDAGGADAWALQDALAMSTTIGAPPDSFNQQGQDWGLPPWRPDRLRELGWAPYRELVRGVLRHAGGVRIDHVMGLFRLWWVPAGASAAEGTYVSYDADAMLGVLALEAVRAGALVVGEDLGTVEDRVRTSLDAAGVLGSAVLWFETDGRRADAAAGLARADDGQRHDPRPADRRRLPRRGARAGARRARTARDAGGAGARAGPRGPRGAARHAREGGPRRGRRRRRGAGHARCAGRLPVPGRARGLRRRGRRPAPAQPAGHRRRVPELAPAGRRRLGPAAHPRAAAGRARCRARRTSAGRGRARQGGRFWPSGPHRPSPHGCTSPCDAREKVDVNRRRARAVCLSSALLTVALTASPALAANDELGPREGADVGSGLSTGGTLVLFVLVPLAILLGTAALVWLPGMVKADRYRPQKGWSAAPVWFAGPPDPVAAVETAEPGTASRGGASGNW